MPAYNIYVKLIIKYTMLAQIYNELSFSISGCFFVFCLFAQRRIGFLLHSKSFHSLRTISPEEVKVQI